MTLFETYKLLHVLTAIVWVGGGFLALFFTGRVLRADPVHQLGYSHDVDFVANRVFAPASILTLLFGILMVIEGNYDFSDTFIVIGIGGIVISAAIGMGYFGPQTKKLIGELEAGDPAAGTRMRAMYRMSYLDVGILLFVVWAMVAKPGL